MPRYGRPETARRPWTHQIALDLGDERYRDSRADAGYSMRPPSPEEIAAQAARIEAAERVLDQLFAKAEVLLAQAVLALRK